MEVMTQPQNAKRVEQVQIVAGYWFIAKSLNTAQN